jgi:hypothetical protein
MTWETIVLLRIFESSVTFDTFCLAFHPVKWYKPLSVLKYTRV